MLNDTLIRGLKFTGKPKKHFDGGGMYLHISPTGGKLGEESVIRYYLAEFTE